MKMMRSMVASVGHAWRGLLLAFRTERSFRMQTAVGLVVIVVSLVLPLGLAERLTLWMATAAVLVLELVNSMVERLVDLAKPRLNVYVKDVKDLMAAAVLLASLAAACIGLVILMPYFVPLLERL